MARLIIEKRPCSASITTARISGFNDGELNELKSMEHHEAEEKLIDMLNSRNDNIGRSWAYGYGIYGMWFDNEYAYINIGNSCD